MNWLSPVLTLALLLPSWLVMLAVTLVTQRRNKRQREDIERLCRMLDKADFWSREEAQAESTDYLMMLEQLNEQHVRPALARAEAAERELAAVRAELQELLAADGDVEAEIRAEVQALLCDDEDSDGFTDYARKPVFFEHTVDGRLLRSVDAGETVMVALYTADGTEVFQPTTEPGPYVPPAQPVILHCLPGEHEWEHDGSAGDWCVRCHVMRADIDSAYAAGLAFNRLKQGHEW